MSLGAQCQAGIVGVSRPDSVLKLLQVFKMGGNSSCFLSFLVTLPIYAFPALVFAESFGKILMVGPKFGILVAGIFVLANCLGSSLVFLDKICAKMGIGYRFSEKCLTRSSWFGGAPGTFLFMALFNHKTSQEKAHFRGEIWTAVQTHFLLAVGVGAIWYVSAIWYVMDF